MTAKKTQNPKLILFDLDGTIADSLMAGLGSMNQLRYFFGYKKLDPADPRLRLTTGMDFVKNILGLNILQVVLWSKLLKFLVTRQATTIGVYKGWKTALKSLKKKYELGLMTSAPRVYADTILGNAGLLNLFDLKVTDIKYHRKASSLKKILQNKKLKPDEVVYVGDETRDLQACLKCGVPFVAVNWGKDHESLFASLTHPLRGIIGRPAELANLITRRPRRESGSTARHRPKPAD